ncbi:MAG: methyltransferase domain-containing protein [Halobacteriota archaeon]
MGDEEPKIGRDEPEGGNSVVRDEYKIAKQNEELWDSRAETYDTRFSFTRWTQRKLVSLLQLGDNPYLLDLACGTGWALRYAANRTNGQGEFYGVDNSSKMIAQHKPNLKAAAACIFIKQELRRSRSTTTSSMSLCLPTPSITFQTPKRHLERQTEC